jgi:hypothetical protein
VANGTGVLRRGLVVAAVAVILGAPAIAAARYQDAGAGHGYLAPAGITARAAPAPSGATAPAAPVASGGSPAAAARASVDAALADQAAALARGDAVGFLATVDPAVQAPMRRRFEALRALRAVGFSAKVTDEPTPAGDGRWQATVELRFCAAADGCTAAPVPVTTTWAVDRNSVRLVEYTPTTQFGPRPWEASELRAVAGARVVVAAPPRYANRLASTLAVAERAAARADAYARWRVKPSRYVVYFAGPDEWSTWYGVKQPAWAAAFAMPISPEYTEIVLNAGRIESGEVLSTLTHEFAHVTTLAGVQRNYTDSWLLVEGIAEYVTHADRPATAYPWLSGTRRYVRGGQWQGTAGLAAPPESATVGDATGRYGVAYLAVRRLATRFGEAKMLEFFAAVARDGQNATAAAPAVLGAPWPDVAADCDRYIREVAG